MGTEEGDRAIWRESHPEVGFAQTSSQESGLETPKALTAWVVLWRSAFGYPNKNWELARIGFLRQKCQ